MNHLLIEQTKSLIDQTLPNISNISNMIALLYNELDHINWLGFYIYDESQNQLYLGPFQGKVACTIIPNNKGVVGTCAHLKETIRVDNVHTFPGHIACDCASQSEICIPIKKEDKLLAVLDIDSIIQNRFSSEDQETLEVIAQEFITLFDKA